MRAASTGVAVAAAALACSLAPALGGCASVAVPVGEWARPVDLDLNSESLKGAKVAVLCGRLSPRGEFVEGGMNCSALERAFEQVGAEIVPAHGTSGSGIAGIGFPAASPPPESAENPEVRESSGAASPAPIVSTSGPQSRRPDWTVTFVEKGVVRKADSALSQIAFTYSNGLVSMVQATASEAELWLSDGSGARVERHVLRVEETQVGGLSALVGKLSNPTAEDRRNSSLSQAFYDFARNRVRSRLIREAPVRRAPAPAWNVAAPAPAWSMAAPAPAGSSAPAQGGRAQ